VATLRAQRRRAFVRGEAGQLGRGDEGGHERAPTVTWHAH
jgi:hypothetical protein